VVFKSKEGGKSKSKIKEKKEREKKNQTSGLPPTKRLFRVNSLTLVEFEDHVNQMEEVNTSS